MNNVQDYKYIDFFQQMYLENFSIVKYSSKGSNDRACEEQTYMFFVKYMERCDKGIFEFVVLYIV